MVVGGKLRILTAEMMKSEAPWWPTLSECMACEDRGGVSKLFFSEHSTANESI